MTSDSETPETFGGGRVDRESGNQAAAKLNISNTGTQKSTTLERNLIETRQWQHATHLPALPAPCLSPSKLLVDQVVNEVGLLALVPGERLPLRQRHRRGFRGVVLRGRDAAHSQAALCLSRPVRGLPPPCVPACRWRVSWSRLALFPNCDSASG